MSLSVYITLDFKGGQEKLVKALESVRQTCLDLPFKKVAKVTPKVLTPSHYSTFMDWQKACSYPNNSAENLHKRNEAMRELGFEIWELVAVPDEVHTKLMQHRGSVNMVSFQILVGDGCESMELHFYEIKKNHWHCHEAVKTQYSEEFVPCHLRVITVLDLLAKEKDMSVAVTDEGEYWEKRDLSVLAKNVNEYTALLTGLSKVFKKATAGTNIQVEAEIDKSKNIVIVKPPTTK